MFQLLLGTYRKKLTELHRHQHARHQKQLEDAALDDEKIKSQLEGKTVRKVIVVPGRMVNIVAN